MLTKQKKIKREDNLIHALVYRYLPFWPIFLLVLIICIALGWVYLQYATPVYQASATLIIKDEKKGVDDSRMMESINAFDSKKIVENEIEVIQSRKLMNRVVRDLYLDAPIFEEGDLKDRSAYTISPIVVKLKDSTIIRANNEEPLKFYFTYNSKSKTVELGNEEYSLNDWVDIKGYTLMFLKNGRFSTKAKGELYFILSDVSDVTRGLLSSLDVSATDKLSTVVNLVFEDPVPSKAEDVLDHLIAAYNQNAVADRNLLATNTLRFIEDRMENVENDLIALEREIQRYRSSSGAVDLSEQSKLYLKDVGENDRRISDSRLQLAVLDRVERYVVAKNNETGIVPSTVGIDDPVLSQLLEKLYNSEIQYERLRKTTGENNPLLVSISDEIEKIRPSILENIRNQKSNINARLSNLNATSGRFNSALSNLPEKERALLEITRRKAIKSDLFSYLLQKREETALSYAPGEGDGRVVDLAEASNLPVSPKSMIIYATSILCAFGMSTAFIVSKEVLNKKILFRTEIEWFTDIPIVAELAFIKKSDKKVNEQKKAANTEQFRDLRISLGLFGDSSGRKKIVVTSSIEGEGKSFVSENLALNLSSAGKKVVIVNFDLHKKVNSSIFPSREIGGLAGYLKGEVELKDIVEVTPHDNLYSIGAGKFSPNISNIFLDYNFKPLFDYLDEDFDYVLVDTPPLGVSTDAYILSKYSDYTLYVIRHGYTPKEFIQNMEVNSNLSNIKNLYIVFNALKDRGFVNAKYGYSYGYTQQRMAYNTNT